MSRRHLDAVLAFLSTPAGKKVLSLVLGIVFALAGITGAYQLVVPDPAGGPPLATVTIPPLRTVPVPGRDAVVDRDAQFELGEQAAAESLALGVGIHEDLADQTPPGIPDAARKIAAEHTKGLGPALPVGGAQTYSCRRHLLPNRWGDRHGARVEGFVLHYTVSPPGSLDSIFRYFASPGVFASSTFGFEVTTGRCEQWVPFTAAPWTQLAFNSRVESVEIMARGTEPTSWWLAQPGLSRLAQLVADRLRARGLPARFVDPAGCGFQQAGWTDHYHLECGNTHHDVMPNFPYARFDAMVRRFYGENPRPKTEGCSPLAIQRALRQLGYPVQLNGVYGPRTKAAVRRFQARTAGLDVYGVVGPATGRALGLRGCRA